ERRRMPEAAAIEHMWSIREHLPDEVWERFVRDRRNAQWLRLRGVNAGRGPRYMTADDLPVPLREELRAHAQRTARLQAAQQRATLAGDHERWLRAHVLTQLERVRHDVAMRELGAGIASRP